MMTHVRRLLALVAAMVAAVALVGLGAPASAADPHLPIPDLPITNVPVPGLGDCKESPTPDMPGQGIAGFFSQPPETLPTEEDPFAPGSSTTIYEQYGYSGLRWHTYDLGCGPDAMRQPDAVIGTAMSNWIMQAPIALTALTGSLTQVAFEPTFLDVFNPIIEQVSSALHENLFASWVPAVIALLGLVILFKARRSALATTAAAIGWALIVVMLATALFRWPLAAGHAVDATVTGTLGSVVSRLDGHSGSVDPGTAVASNVEESIFYRAWLAGTLGSPDSQTAQKYGPSLFKAQALTWREAAVLQDDPEEGRKIIEAKKKDWESLASKIQDEDPEAYEHLTGSRSETRVGYAVLSALGAFLALPFLLLSSLLLLGCFLIVRLAVMIFPAFATLGAFPASRGLVLGLGRTVGAAVVNAIIFGIGAGITVTVLGILFHPGGSAPGWLSLVLMPLFSFMMWMALRPFRRLTTMVHPDRDHFGGFAGSLGSASAAGRRWAKQLARTGITAATGGAAAGATMAALDDDPPYPTPPERAEARPTPAPAVHAPAALPAGVIADHPSPAGALPGGAVGGSPRRLLGPDPESGSPASHSGGRHRATQGAAPAATRAPAPPPVPALNEGFVPTPSSTGAPPSPTEPEWLDGEDVYTIYRPGAHDGEDDAGDAA